MTVAERMRDKLMSALAPVRLEIEDESFRHVGHIGSRPGGETHFRVVVVAAAFAGKSRLERHRLVNSILAEELAGPIHALRLTIQSPDEMFSGADVERRAR